MATEAANNLTDLQLDVLLELHDATTPGKWRVADERWDDIFVEADDGRNVGCIGDEPQDGINAMFIVVAKNAFRDIVAQAKESNRKDVEVERLQRELAAVRQRTFGPKLALTRNERKEPDAI